MVCGVAWCGGGGGGAHAIIILTHGHVYISMPPGIFLLKPRPQLWKGVLEGASAGTAVAAAGLQHLRIRGARHHRSSGLLAPH